MPGNSNAAALRHGSIQETFHSDKISDREKKQSAEMPPYIQFRIFAICTSVTSFVFSILYVHILSYKFYVIFNAKSRGTKVPRLYL